MSEVIEVDRADYLVIELPVPAETIELAGPAIDLLEVTEQGPAGPQGPIGPSGGSAITAICGAALGGHRMVRYRAFDALIDYASAAAPADFGNVLGMTIHAADEGDPVDVIRSGAIIEPSWSWIVGAPVYLGVSGALTQTPPTAPSFCMIVGFPVTATMLFISGREPVNLI